MLKFYVVWVSEFFAFDMMHHASVYCDNMKCFIMVRLLGILKMLLGIGLNIRRSFLLYGKGK